MRKRMQVVLQDPFASLSPRMTVGQIVNEGLARFTMEGQEGFGIAESWHNVTE